MREWIVNPLVLIAGVSLVVAGIFYRWALGVSRRLAKDAEDGGKPKDRSDVLMALGNAVLAGGAIALASFLIQQQVIQQRDRETRLLMTADLSGYDPGPTAAERGTFAPDSSECVEDIATIKDQKNRRFLRGRYLTAKRLNGARLGGLNMEDTEFRDAELRGAVMACSLLDGASFLHADLAAADLRGASLRRADFRAASFDRAELPSKRSAWRGVKVNAQTCWPTRLGPKFIRRLPVLPQPIKAIELPAGDRSAEDFPAAFGHYCGRKTAMLVKGQADRDAPPAPGEVRPAETTPTHLDAAGVVALSRAVEGGVMRALALSTQSGPPSAAPPASPPPASPPPPPLSPAGATGQAATASTQPPPTTATPAPPTTSATTP